MSRAVVSEVMSAAEDPRPVLCTLERVPLVVVKGGILEREARVRGRLRESN